MDYQIQQVITVCPHVSQKLIERDLRITGSVPDTINRILDGIISDEWDETPGGSNDQSAAGINSASTSRTLLQHHSSDDDDDDDEILPHIALGPSSSSKVSPPSGNINPVSLDCKPDCASSGASIFPNHYATENGICRSPRYYAPGSDRSKGNTGHIACSEVSAVTNCPEPGEDLDKPVLPSENHVISSESSKPICGKVSDSNRTNADSGASSKGAGSISPSRTETLDLTGDESSDDEIIAAKEVGLEIAVSSSDDDEEVKLSKSSHTKNEDLSGINSLNHAEVGVKDNRHIDDTTDAANSECSQDDSKQLMQVNVPESDAHRNKMIDISSSDESEGDELPLWRRVQLKRGQSSTGPSGGFGRNLGVIAPKRDRDIVDVVDENVVDSLSLPESCVSTQGSQSSTISGSSVTSKDVPSSVDRLLGRESSVVSSVTATSTDLSQLSDVAKGIKRKKRSPEEIQEMRQQALEKKSERERKRDEQNRLREQKKKEKQKEVDHRKALREAHKALRPEECMKLMTISVDQSLLEGKCGSAILQKLQELTCKVAIVKQPIEGAVTWCRQSTEQNLGQDIELSSLQKTIPETESVVVIDINAFVPLVNASLQDRVGQPVDSETLNQHASGSIQSLGKEAVTYIVHGAQQYFRNSKNRHQRNYRSAVLGEDPNNNARKKGKRKRNDDDLPNVSRVQMEEALIDLQLQHGCNVHFRETSDTVAEFIAMFAKAVAEKPFKKQRDKATFSFHVNSEWAGGAKVAKDGCGLIKVWKQQFQQFRNVSPEIAAAIVAQYPSPQLLLKGYERCSSTKEAELLLQDIVIRRGEGVLATSRRVGPELSRRVHKQMTSNDETVLL